MSSGAATVRMAVMRGARIVRAVLAVLVPVVAAFGMAEGAVPGAANAEDAVVKSERPVRPGADEPGEARVRVEWDRDAGEVRREVFGMNTFVATDPRRAADPAWQEGIAFLAPALLRYHHAALLADPRENPVGWWDPERGSWARERVLEALRAWRPPAGVRRLLSLPGWPRAYDADGDGLLDAARVQDFAAMAADLVRLVNVEAAAGFTHLEVTNEKDGAYWVEPSRRGERSRAEELAAVHRAVAAAVRAVDPSILVGGPAAMRPDFVADLRAYVIAAGPDLDFLSFHAYASGDTADPDAEVYAKVERMAAHARELVALAREAATGRELEVHLNEYNISWTWETQEPRMVNHKGAVFDALALIAFAQVEGLTAANAWNDMDGVYGKLAWDGARRPSAEVFAHFNRHHADRRVVVASDAPERVVVFATRGRAGRALTLVNRTGAEQTVLLERPSTLGGWRWQARRIDEAGVADLPVREGRGVLVLPPHSVTLFREGGGT